MLEKAKTLGGILLGIAIFACVLALPIVFVKGSLWASEHLLEPLILVGWIALGLDLLVLAPLSISRSLRVFTGVGIFLSSYIFGLVTWLTAFVITYALWGLWAVILGLVLFGGGMVPIAIVGTMFKGFWQHFFTLIALVVITFGSRLGGLAIASSTERIATSSVGR